MISLIRITAQREDQKVRTNNLFSVRSAGSGHSFIEVIDYVSTT